LCFLNYFKRLGQFGVEDEMVVFERRRFVKNSAPWNWGASAARLCAVEMVDKGSIEDCAAATHVDFANRFVGGGALENDFMMEEILFVIRPELIVAMALCSFMHDEESVAISGAKRHSLHSGYAHSFAFEGDYSKEKNVPTVVAIDALQGMAKIQWKGELFNSCVVVFDKNNVLFVEGLMLRDVNKARIGFEGARTLATGNWGCGAFGNDHTLKFLQQWLAASEAGVEKMFYHTFGDKRAAHLWVLVSGLKGMTVGELWTFMKEAAVPADAMHFKRVLSERATEEKKKLKK
jgi:poly(ADP-ribose) glycohydrolase